MTIGFLNVQTLAVIEHCEEWGPFYGEQINQDAHFASCRGLFSPTAKPYG